MIRPTCGAVSATALAVALTGCQSIRQQQQALNTCTPPKDLTALSGTYQAKNIGINSNGKHEGTSTLTLRVDQDGVITAVRSWASTTDFGHTENGSSTRGDSEQLIGVFDKTDCDIGFAETDETGHYRGRLLADGSIDVLQLQAGEKPVVMLNRFKRQGQPD